MIAIIDGATAVSGLSGGLGGPADQALFAVLRSQADVVPVAAGTVRAEHYGPSKAPVAVVSGSGWRLHSLCEQDGFLFLQYRLR